MTTIKQRRILRDLIQYFKISIGFDNVKLLKLPTILDQEIKKLRYKDLTIASRNLSLKK